MLVVLVGAPGAASAQRVERWAGPVGDPTESELSEARSLYERGSRAVDDFRFADGLRFFERAYQLSGMGAALFGVGFALQSMGRFRDARDAFDTLLTRHEDLPEDFRARAERFRGENESRVAVLSLVGLPDGVALVELDGAAVEDRGQRPLDLETDPGVRRLRVDVRGHAPFDWEGRAREGERLEIVVDVQPMDAADDGSILESPWLWGGVGVAVIAVGVIVGVVLYNGAQIEPQLPDHIVLCEDCT
jgi:hypothetical protein